jgi:ankyrin repeat protein
MENNIEDFLYKKYKDLTQKEINDAFLNACFKNKAEFETVRYLLTSPNLKFNADIHYCEDYGLTWACMNGDFSLVRYLLTSSELKEHINIHARDDYAVRWACENEHMEIVKYLLNSSELKEHANIHCQNDELFKKCYEKGYIDIIKYFVVDLNMQKTPEIDKFIEESPPNFIIEELDNWFKIHQLQHNLENELKPNIEKNEKRIKL